MNAVLDAAAFVFDAVELVFDAAYLRCVLRMLRLGKILCLGKHSRFL